MARDRSGAGRGLDALIGVGGGEDRSAPYSGPKALMLAVLEDAIRAFLSKDARARDEASSWIFGPHPRSVFSFAVVCETLGLEPKAVRVAIRGMNRRELSPDLLPRSRPNARGGNGALSYPSEVSEEESTG